MNLAIIYSVGAAGVALLLGYKFTGKKPYAFWGQMCLIASFGLIAFELILGRAFVTGAAFAFASLAQVYAIAATRIRKRQEKPSGHLINETKP